MDPQEMNYQVPGQPPVQAPVQTPAPEAAYYGAGSAGAGFSCAGGTAYNASAAAATAATPAPQKSRGWIVGLAIVVAVFLLCAFSIASCTSLLGGALATAEQKSDTVAIITLDGTIQYDGSSCSPEGLKELLDEAEADDSVKAVVLRVNSGGGVATAGEEMAVYLKEFSKPVVVSSAATNASAAYEISSQAEYIYVAKSSAVGSIGTAMQFVDYSDLYELLGINYDDIVSSSGKDSTYGTRALTEEERAYYQAMVDQINENFIEAVAEGRGMSVESVRALATGYVFTGTDAVENGLADAVGTLEDACDKAAELAGVSDYETRKLSNTSSLSTLYDLLTGETDGETSAQSAQDLQKFMKELKIYASSVE